MQVRRVKVIGVDWKQDNNSSIPIYIQIKRFIRSKIQAGEWCIGSRLPTQRELADRLGVNRSTVVAALEELAAEGLIEGRGSKGTIVVNNTWSLLTSKNSEYWSTYIDGGNHKPNYTLIRDIYKIKHTRDVIRLGTGELSPKLYPKEGMDRLIKEALKKITAMSYEEPKGLIILREKLALYLKSLGISASPESIMIVSGGLQALQLIASSLLPKNSTIYMEEPSYISSLNIIQTAGAKMIGVNMDEEGISISDLLNKAQGKTSSMLYTIPTFHNPTGTTMTEERRKELVKTCNELMLPVIEDDTYRETWLKSPPPKPMKAHDETGGVLYMGSVSKTLASGMRIGWVVGPEQVIDRLADIKMQMDYGSSSIAQWTVAECLETGMYMEYTAELRKELYRRREICIEVLNKHFCNIASWKVPGGGFYIWLNLESSINTNELFKRALSSGILLNPGAIYQNGDTRHLRISYSYADLGDLERGLTILSKIIKDNL